MLEGGARCSTLVKNTTEQHRCVKILDCCYERAAWHDARWCSGRESGADAAHLAALAPSVKRAKTDDSRPRLAPFHPQQLIVFACIKADGTSRACMPAHQSDVDHRLRDMGIPRRWGQRYACVHACKTLQCGFSLRDTVYQDSAYSEPVPLALEHSKNGCAVSPPGVGSSKIVRSFLRWHSNDLGSRSNAHERLAVAFALCQPNRPGQIAHAAPCHSCTHLCGGHGKYVGFPCNAFGSSCNRIHCWSTSWPWDSLILPLLARRSRAWVPGTGYGSGERRGDGQVWDSKQAASAQAAQVGVADG